MVSIVLDRVTKRFGAQVAVDALETSFGSGQVTCLLGPSGCGKTTLMRMIAGLEAPTSGRILIGGRDVAGVPPRHRDVGMVFQYPVMYPTLSVGENIEEPLRYDRSVGGAERGKRVDEMLDVLDMRDLRGALIDELNTGLRQKVAVGRAVARHAEVVLFDEPTTNIEVDAKLTLIRAIKAVTQRLRQTIVYVTHDQTEAMTLADSIALMERGRIVQQDAPRALYAAPRTRFAGWFLGSPGMNYVGAEVRDGAVHSLVLAAPIALPGGRGRPVVLGVRPEWVTVGAGRAEGEVTDCVIGIGGRRLMTVRLGAETLRIKCSAAEAVAPGGRVRFSVPPDRVVLFDDAGEAIEAAARMPA